MNGFCANEKLTENFGTVRSHWNWDFMATLHENTKIWRSNRFKDVYQVTEIVVDNADVGQMTPRNGLGWRSMKWLQQGKIVIVGDGYYAPLTLLIKEGTEWRRQRTKIHK